MGSPSGHGPLRSAHHGPTGESRIALILDKGKEVSRLFYGYWQRDSDRNLNFEGAKSALRALGRPALILLVGHAGDGERAGSGRQSV